MTNLFENYKNSVIAVAISGGKDSMCLLDLLLKEAKAKNITVKAVNIDHSIRGIDSEKDSEFVKNYCNLKNVELKFFKVDAVEYSKNSGITLEESARALRYRIFDELLSESYADYIATAHHLLDNFETVLLNLFRGTGVKGLAGIPEKRGKYIRPLLNVSKTEIDEYVKLNSLPFVTDLTNDDAKYTRNYLRKEVIPKILDKFPSADRATKRLCSICKEEDEFLDGLASLQIIRENEKFYLPLTTPPVLLKRALIIALNELGVKKDYESAHIESVLNLLNLNNGSKITLPKGLVAVKEYDKISLYQDKALPLQEELKYTGKSFTYLKNEYIITSAEIENALCFDGDKIPKTAVIRSKQESDLFTKFGGGTKKLKDYFIDKKIPRFDRNSIPLLADGNKILLVFGVEISDEIKVTSQTVNKLYTK